MSRMVLAVSAALLFLSLPVSVDANQPDSVAPGDFFTSGGSGCTLAFVFDGTGAYAGKVYFATASHCFGNGAGTGHQVSVSSFASDFGTVAFRGGPGGGSGFARATDYAFVEVKPQYHDEVETQPRGFLWQAPPGVATEGETFAGDIIGNTGHGIATSISVDVRENRVGILTGNSDGVFHSTSATSFGDSGGPVIHYSTGKALGIVSGIDVGFACCTDIVGGVDFNGPTIEGALADAASKGFTVQLRV